MNKVRLKKASLPSILSSTFRNLALLKHFLRHRFFNFSIFTKPGVAFILLSVSGIRWLPSFSNLGSTLDLRGEFQGRYWASFFVGVVSIRKMQSQRFLKRVWISIPIFSPPRTERKTAPTAYTLVHSCIPYARSSNWYTQWSKNHWTRSNQQSLNGWKFSF